METADVVAQAAERTEHGSVSGGVDATRPVALRALEAQRLLDLIAIKAMPALAAGIITYLHMSDVGSAAIVAGAMFVALQLVERSSLPLELMPAARLTLALAAPFLGAGIAALVLLGAGNPVAFAHLEAPIFGCWLVMALGAWVKTRFEDIRPARVGVVGPPEFAADLAAELEAAGIRGYRVVGWFGAEAAPSTGPGLERLGGLMELRGTTIKRRIELLVVAPGDGPWATETVAERSIVTLIADACIDLPVRMIHANELYEQLLGHVPLGTTDAAWYRYIMHPNFRPTTSASKRAFDLVVSLLMGIASLPFLGIAAIAIKATDRGPVFYRQRRVGERGKEIEIVKLRTMVMDAEAGGPQWCEAGDERITAVGRLLRRTHVDELPQIWNVLRGDMTLVGPRPERPQIVAELENRFSHYKRRHLVKPGIAGWAQLRCGYGGSDLGTAWKLCHDLFYVKRRSLLADWLIMVETAFEATRDAHRALQAPRERFIVGEVRD